MRALTVLLTDVVRPVADCCRVRASVREMAEVPEMEVVALWMEFCALVLAVRTPCSVLGSEVLTACQGVLVVFVK